MAEDRLTIVFMPESAYGPTNNCVGIGKLLEQRGHRVVFAAEASWKGRLEPLGFEEDLVDLAPPPEDEEEQDAGQFWTDFITETAPEFRKPTIEQLSTFIEPVFSSLIDGATYCEPQLKRDPGPRPARCDRRGQRERVPGAAHERCPVGPDHVVQPARDEGPRPAAGLQRLPDRRHDRVGGLPRGVRAGAPADLGAVQRVRARQRGAAGARPRVHPRVRAPEPLRVPGGRGLPAVASARADVAPPRVERARHRGAVGGARRAPRTRRRARVPVARIARVSRRRADAPARDGARRHPAPLRRQQGSARGRVRPSRQHVGRGERSRRRPSSRDATW